MEKITEEHIAALREGLGMLQAEFAGNPRVAEDPKEAAIARMSEAALVVILALAQDLKARQP